MPILGRYSDHGGWPWWMTGIKAMAGPSFPGSSTRTHVISEPAPCTCGGSVATTRDHLVWRHSGLAHTAKCAAPATAGAVFGNQDFLGSEQSQNWAMRRQGTIREWVPTLEEAHIHTQAPGPGQSRATARKDPQEVPTYEWTRLHCIPIPRHVRPGVAVVGSPAAGDLLGPVDKGSGNPTSGSGGAVDD